METRDKLRAKLREEFGWIDGVCWSMADRLLDRPYMENVWENLARDYPGVKLGEVSVILTHIMPRFRR